MQTNFWNQSVLFAATKMFLFKVSASFLMIMTADCLPQLFAQQENSGSSGKFFNTIGNIVHSFVGRSTDSRENFRRLQQLGKLQEVNSDTVPFPCPLNGTKSPQKPSSVHELRPGDIGVVAAMGDSLTAGVGLTSSEILHIFHENRGFSPSGGGQLTWRTSLTVPNILKVFNPNLYGYTNGSFLVHQSGASFNVAETGFVSKNLPDMARKLLNRIKNDPEVNFTGDWKLVTILMGANDFCNRICNGNKNLTQKLLQHKKDLMLTLRILRDNMPRTLVNLILPPNLKIITEFKAMPLLCDLVRSFICPCLYGTTLAKSRTKFFEFMEAWQAIDEDVALLDEFDLDDFSVVAQIFPKNLTFPRRSNGQTDYSYLSVDCFHLSQKASAGLANAIWNSMLEPVGQKDIHGTLHKQKLKCPTSEHPYIYTNRNSKKSETSSETDNFTLINQ